MSTVEGFLTALQPCGSLTVCFDDLPMASLIEPFLTVVARPAYEFGATALRLLLERLADPTHPPQGVVMAPELIVGHST